MTFTSDPDPLSLQWSQLGGVSTCACNTSRIACIYVHRTHRVVQPAVSHAAPPRLGFALCPDWHIFLLLCLYMSHFIYAPEREAFLGLDAASLGCRPRHVFSVTWCCLAGFRGSHFCAAGAASCPHRLPGRGPHPGDGAWLMKQGHALRLRWGAALSPSLRLSRGPCHLTAASVCQLWSACRPSHTFRRQTEALRRAQGPGESAPGEAGGARGLLCLLCPVEFGPSRWQAGGSGRLSAQCLPLPRRAAHESCKPRQKLLSLRLSVTPEPPPMPFPTLSGPTHVGHDRSAHRLPWEIAAPLVSASGGDMGGEVGTAPAPHPNDHAPCCSHGGTAVAAEWDAEPGWGPPPRLQVGLRWLLRSRQPREAFQSAA